MCLGVPGRILNVTKAEGTRDRLAQVDFQGSQVQVSLAMVPQAKVGDWILVHAGFALTVLDEAEAIETWKWLDEAELAGEMPPDMLAKVRVARN
jgi:hydrogenase expression/formation protein HypC